jgi:uncharacterized protein (TIGR00288 family)
MQANSKDEMSATMAVFFDLENIVIGVRQSEYPKFNIKHVIERLLTKGNIVVKKAYCDWERYRDFKRQLHESSFELIEVPHINQSGKNSADIRMVVDALDLCYTKQHVDTFIILSGDSDFSPLVSKLRENAKTVIGLGVKNSSSDLFINNCDEFIYYDDLVRNEAQNARTATARSSSRKQAARTPRAEAGEKAAEPKVSEPKLLDAAEGLEKLMAVVEALAEERGERLIQNSMIKDTLKRRNPGFNERAYGFRTFGAMLEAAEKQGLVRLQRDEKSGGYIIRPRENDG